MDLIPEEVNLLPVIKQYTTFERSIKSIVKEGHIYLGMMRILAKLKANMKNREQEKEKTDISTNAIYMALFHLSAP